MGRNALLSSLRIGGVAPVALWRPVTHPRPAIVYAANLNAPPESVPHNSGYFCQDARSCNGWAVHGFCTDKKEAAPASIVNPEATLSAKVKSAMEQPRAAVAEIRTDAGFNCVVDNISTAGAARKHLRENPRRRAYTRAKLDSRRRQGQRWEQASVAVSRQLDALWLDSAAAWRRWLASDRP